MSNSNYVEDSSVAAGASKAIYKTISDIETLLDGDTLLRAGKLRSHLRKALIDGFDEVGQQWYKKGFNRGHKEAYKHYLETKRVPRRLRKEIRRKFVAASKSHPIKLSSRIHD